jgi:RNA polymerase sigma factor (TIGR02999 family)
MRTLRKFNVTDSPRSIKISGHPLANGIDHLPLDADVGRRFIVPKQAIRRGLDLSISAASSSPDSAQHHNDAASRQNLDALFSAAYEELRRLALMVKRSHPGATTSPSSLVHAVWLRLAHSLKLTPRSELHFKRIAAQAMRHVLVEAARRRNAQKRGGADMIVSFDDALDVPISSSKEVLILHTALERLAQVNPRHALMIECRFFGGLNVDDTATILGVSPKTIDRDWRAVKAWLATEIRQGE